MPYNKYIKTNKANYMTCAELNKLAAIVGIAVVVGIPIAMIDTDPKPKTVVEAKAPVRPAGPSPAQIRLNNSNQRKSTIRRQCHTAFKAGMYDPRSFRIEREWFNELPNDDGTGHIAYIADVSGTNGFGGRVRKNIACIADGSVITDYQF